jgi:hypothetical protein
MPLTKGMHVDDLAADAAARFPLEQRTAKPNQERVDAHVVAGLRCHKHGVSASMRRHLAGLPLVRPVNKEPRRTVKRVLLVWDKRGK